MSDKISIYDILTPEWLKETFLLGVNLTLDDGTDYPDAIFEQAIRSAVQAIEADLGIRIDPWTVSGERQDADRDQIDGYWPLRLDVRPVISISSWQARYGQYPAVDMPIDWLVPVDARFGQYHIIPNSGVIGSFQLLHGFPIFSNLTHTHPWIPGYYVVDYRAGFNVLGGTAVIPGGSTSVDVVFSTPMEDPYKVTLSGATGLAARNIDRTGFTIRVSPSDPADRTITWTADPIPANLKQAIGQLAAMLPLDVAGDLIAGAGIASYSVGMDGLSQSISTTSSATNSGYGARVIQFQKELKAGLQALRAAWRLPGVMAL